MCIRDRPNSIVERGHDTFTMSTKTDSKNAVEQAYENLKKKDVFKSMTKI